MFTMLSSSSSKVLAAALLLFVACGGPHHAVVMGQTVTQVCENNADCNNGNIDGNLFCEETYDFDSNSNVNKCNRCSQNCFTVDRSYNFSIASEFGCPESCCDWDLEIETTEASTTWMGTWTIAPCGDNAEDLTIFAGWIEGKEATGKSVAEFAAESTPCAVVRYEYDDGLFPTVASVVDCSDEEEEEEETTDADGNEEEGCDSINSFRTFAIWTVNESTGDMEFYQGTPEPFVIEFGWGDLCGALEDLGKSLARGLIITIVIIVLAICACVAGCIYCCVKKNKTEQ